MLRRRDLNGWIPRLVGAVIAGTAMAELGVDDIEICPWALREGILLRRTVRLPSPDTLHQVQLIQAIGAGLTSLAEHRQTRGF